MQSNPIQQRIDLICEKWEDAKIYKDARIVRIVCQADEEEMVDTFYTYMIGTDTPIADIAFHFEASCGDLKQFGTLLLTELEEIMDIWNNSQKDDRIDYVPVNWKPNDSLQKDKNTAAMFVDNFNRLAKELKLPEGLFAVAIFKGALKDKNFIAWLQDAVKLRISPKVKFLIHDTVTDPRFAGVASALPPTMAAIPLNLNMPKAMEQVAAMGDPKDPGTTYRMVFMKMINAMGAQDESEAEKYGRECITMATENLSKDPYWIMQVVVVNIALGNDKIRYKKKKETLDFADKAVEAATASKEYFENSVTASMLSQGLMFRATVLFMHGNWNEAYSDFSTAFKIYYKGGNISLAIEASRMAGQSAFKASQQTKGIKILVEGARLGKNIDPEIARGSTYLGLLELLLQSNYMSFISPRELDEIARRIYGPDWRNAVVDWKKIPEKNALQQQEPEPATA